MKVLAVDTSGPVCGVAVLADGSIRSEQMALNRKTHSVNLMPMVDRALGMAGFTLEDMDRIAVVTGPGSFTGVRLGVSAVKGMAHGAGKPCVAVDALEAMAAGAGFFPGVICPIQDARAGQVYGAAFMTGGERPERLMEDIPLKLEDYLEAVTQLGVCFLFLGDGMPVHRGKIDGLLGRKAVMAPPHMAFLRPAAAAWLGALETRELDYLALSPEYLRAPSAERNRKLMEAAHAE